MFAGIPDVVSRSLFYPLWDLWDKSGKLKEYRRLKAMSAVWLRDLERVRWARQWESLQKIVAHAYATVPFYRSRGPAPVLDRPEDVRKIPLLSKDDVRRRRDDLISTAFRREGLRRAKTGGSTGVSLELFFDKACEEKRNAAALWSNGWSGWRPGNPVGALWGNPPVARTLKEKVRSACLDRMVFLDTVSLSEESMDAFARALERGKIRFLFGHAHSLYIFAKFVEAHPRPDLKIRGIVSTSMTLLPGERRAIERVFSCRVTDRYGCEEVGLIACQEPLGNLMLINADHVFVEVLRDDGTSVAPGEEGDVVVTDLNNYGMPLLRYRVGDRAVAADRRSLGTGLAALERVTGRTADFLVARDGRLVAGVSLVERTLTAIPGLEQLQIIQEARDQVRLNVVPDGQYGPASEKRLLDEMRAAMGEGISFSVHVVTRVEQERNGKYRFAICRVGPEIPP
jgi:phenylacetate-CoA ligase